MLRAVNDNVHEFSEVFSTEKMEVESQNKFGVQQDCVPLFNCADVTAFLLSPIGIARQIDQNEICKKLMSNSD